MSQIGSGSLPVDLLPSAGIAVTVPGKRRSALAAEISQRVPRSARSR